MHVYELRMDYVNAIAWGLRYLECVKGAIPGVEQLQDLILHGKKPTEPLVLAEKTMHVENFHDTLAVLFTILKLLYLLHPSWGSPLSSVAEADRPKYLEVIKNVVEKDIVKVPLERVSGMGKTAEACGKDRSVIEWPFGESAPSGNFGFDATQESAQYQMYILDQYSRLIFPIVQNVTTLWSQLKIRNEHAFYQVIRMVVNHRKEQGNTDFSGKYEPVFMVSDSHGVSAGWERFTVGGKNYIIVPKLVTGVKIYHLRKESNFYTKKLFWNQMNSLPKGDCKVVFNFGEIDCREGIVTAYTRGYYESLDQSLVALSEMFLDLVTTVRKKYKDMQLFAHPVPQVLVPTRILTHTWNKLLADDINDVQWRLQKLRILRFKSVYVGVSDEECLNGSDEIFSKRGEQEFLQELKLDGTHLSPNYVQSHFAPAFEQALTVTFDPPKKRKASLDDLS